MGNSDRYNKGPDESGNRALLALWHNLPRLAIVAVFVLIAVLAMAINDKKERLEAEKAAAQAEGRKPVNVVLLEIRPNPIVDAVNLPGVIEPWETLDLLTQVSGTVEEVQVEEGDTVRKGQLLVKLEADDYRIALDAAKAAYELAVADHKRAQVMFSKKAIPEADLEALEARVTAARADLDSAALMQARCSITAPMDGVVNRLDAKVGLFLSVGDPVGQILQVNKVKAVVGIPESDVHAVRRVKEVDVTIQALGNRVETAKTHYLASAPESMARVYRLELEIENRRRHIRPGMFVRANVIKKTIKDALSVPLYSIVSRNDEQFVFVARDNVVEKRPVKLGIIEKWQVQVTEGLEPGELVVVEGQRDVEDGQEIEVIQTISQAPEDAGQAPEDKSEDKGQIPEEQAEDSITRPGEAG